ncbi:hypothetical protein LC087_01900 [Bacillus carboniphilus]|uniref:Lipoprotein n=1 Tax=Bacillus carboniphilus TaxID=86663 RepID=A0ABY9JW59_9BACI|nr:DUF6612 family protein [Bacillus carboniphilus]WLR42998.1 hypothetical protein LC087_01900 [Bacillus carboniphilus]
MKKVAVAWILLILSFTLISCDDAKEEIKPRNSVKTTAKVEEKPQEITVEEVMKNIEVESKSIETFSVDSIFLNKLKFGNESEKVKLKTTTKLHRSPLSFQQQGTYQRNEDEQEEFEMYYNDQKFRIRSNDDWSELPKDQLEVFMETYNITENPINQLDLLNENLNDVKLNQSDQEYTLSLTLANPRVKGYIEEKVKDYVTPSEEEGIEIDSMQVKEFVVEMTIDQESYFPKKVKHYISVSLGIDGEKIHMIQNNENVYEDYNEVEEMETMINS